MILADFPFITTWDVVLLYAPAFPGSERISLSFRNLSEPYQHSNLLSRNDYLNRFFLKVSKFVEHADLLSPFTIPQYSEIDSFKDIIAITRALSGLA